MKEVPRKKNLALFALVTSDLISYIGAGISIGYFLVWKWNFPQWVIALLAVLGMILAFIKIYQLSQKELKK